MLTKEFNLNKKIMIILVLVNIIIIYLGYSYALFRVSVIYDNVVVIKTGKIDINVSITGYSNSTISLSGGEKKDITVNLTNDLDIEVTYKMYYEILSGNSDIVVASIENFDDNILGGVMKSSKEINLILENKGINPVTISFGCEGGVVGHELILKNGFEIKVEKPLVKDVFYKKITSSSSCNPITV